MLARKDQIELAEQGRSLLDEKRAALLKEAVRVVDRVMRGSVELERAAREARRALMVAQAEVGLERLRSASFVARGRLHVDIDTINVMGVQMPEIEQKRVRRSALGRGYSVVGSSMFIDEAAAAFESEVEMILQLADSELRLRRLTEEIRQITRRVNALEQVVIPRLQDERDYIEMKLQDREREEHYRLRLIKRRQNEAT